MRDLPLAGTIVREIARKFTPDEERLRCGEMKWLSSRSIRLQKAAYTISLSRPQDRHATLVEESG
jgi:hypothetical protein